MPAMSKALQKGKKLPPAGFDGARLSAVDVRVTGTRSTTRAMRARPGTFEWVFGRRSASISLFHAGSHFAQLWEIAGTADARSPNYEGAGGGGTGWKGLPDRRCDALSELNAACAKLGHGPTQRLTMYCVHGKTASEIAKLYGVADREMAHVLKQDLRDCAIQFRFLSVHGVGK